MKKKQQILIVLPSLTLGGAEKQALEYACCLKKNNQHPHVMGLGKEGDLVPMLKANGIDFETYSFNAFFTTTKIQQLVFLIRFAFYLRKFNFNSVITFTYWPNVIFKLIYRFAGIKKMYWNQRSVDDQLNPVFWERLGSFFKVNYIANSQASADSIVKRYNLNTKDVTVIYNVMHLSKAISKSATNKTTFDIIMVANFFEEKDHFTLIKAFAQLNKETFNYKLKLHLVGSAPGKGVRLLEAKTLVFDLGLTNEEVVFYGSYKNVKRLLEQMDLGVLSTYSEGFSNALMEYMDVGIPIVATDIPANREALGEDNYEWLFPVADEIKLVDLISQLIDKKELRKEIGQRNFERAKNMFNRDRLEKVLVELIIDN